MGRTDRPAQYKQSSKKGRKAWRKNIDLTEVEETIEKEKELAITHGVPSLKELPEEALFQVDTGGDEELKRKLIKRKQIKKNIKSAEILQSIKSSSKVPALLHQKVGSKRTKKIQGVSMKEVNRLVALAGKKEGYSKALIQTDKDSLVKGENTDLWGDEEKVNIKSSEQSTKSWSKATVVPETLKQPPVLVQHLEELPHAGKSYNPDKANWEALINKEYQLEKVNEDRRNQMEEYRAKIQHLMETIDCTEESDDDDNEEEDAQSADEDSKDIRLSVNPVAKNKKKSKYQRNKMKRHEEKMKLIAEMKKYKAQLHELEQLEKVQNEVAAKVEEPKAKSKPDETKGKKNRKLGTKHSVLEGTLDVKFSDELGDSLRKLRPEGNLLYENMKKLQSSGKIESRIPFRKSRKYKPRITEKWVYKDFK